MTFVNVFGRNVLVKVIKIDGIFKNVKNRSINLTMFCIKRTKRLLHIFVIRTYEAENRTYPIHSLS